MRYIINENQSELLQKTFNSLMSNFTSLEEVERVYDYYDSKRGSYIDFTPINFYEDTEYEGAWEEDDWTFMYALEPPYGETVEGYPTPVLIYPKNRFKNLLDMFGDRFNDLLKEWFETTYGYRVNTVINDYESENFIPYS
jgi:hypothetical protein